MRGGRTISMAGLAGFMQGKRRKLSSGRSPLVHSPFVQTALLRPAPHRGAARGLTAHRWAIPAHSKEKEKMKRILAFTILAGLALAQPPTQSQVGRGQMAAPSTSVKTDLPAQTVTITINLSADQVTALEKQRRDNFSAVVDPTTGATILQPVNPDVASQLKADLGPLFVQRSEERRVGEEGR